MFNKEKVLAIIPARKGSKRLPFKNRLDLNGKPLISWTIESAIKSSYIDDIIISTDDEEIIKIANSYNINVPFKRPKILSNDHSTSLDVIFHAIKFLKNKNKIYDIIILLQPTSPLRDYIEIDSSFELLKNKIESVVSVCETDHSNLWSNNLPKNHSLENFINPKYIGLRSQDLPKFYMLNGAIFLSRINYLKKNKSFFGKKSKAFVMPRQKSIDIDSKIDFEICKILINENSKSHS